jgi:hypothetical protein
MINLWSMKWTESPTIDLLIADVHRPHCPSKLRVDIFLFAVQATLFLRLEAASPSPPTTATSATAATSTSASAAAAAATTTGTSATICLFPGLVFGLWRIVNEERVQGQRVWKDDVTNR